VVGAFLYNYPAMNFGSLRQFFVRVFGFRKGGVSKSKLVGLYLSQTNSREAYTPDLQQNRQRRNGRFSHNRERA
jgi:hypothetical protein